MARLSASPAARVVAAALLLGTVAAAQAQWQWRDERGQMQYSDLPPPRSVPDRNILQRPRPTASVRAAEPPAAAASAAASAPAGSVDPALEARRRQAEQQQTAQRKAEEAQAAQRAAEQRAQNCGRAREQVRLLESGQRVTRANAQGEREYLDDGSRARELGYARQIVASECR